MSSVNRGAVRRPAILLGAALSLAFSAGANASRDLWDPVPASDAGRNELSLPMPCGGKMVFRRIQTSAKGPLDDVKVSVGISSGEAQPAVDSAGSSYIAGSFSPKTPKEGRYYWIGKYEVTQAQYDAVMTDGQKCPNGDMKLGVPAVKISWYDAMEFTRKYNRWLYENAPDKMPKEDGQPGFIRLPTGTEWEYAARGGVAGETGRDAPENVDDVAWSSGSANGRLQLVGLKKADGSGLFDMLGNADEMTSTPFRLSKRSREHGQASGFETREAATRPRAQAFSTVSGQSISTIQAERSLRQRPSASGRLLELRPSRHQTASMRSGRNGAASVMTAIKTTLTAATQELSAKSRSLRRS